jgi:hypothetical protein
MTAKMYGSSNGGKSNLLPIATESSLITLMPEFIMSEAKVNDPLL